MFNSRMKNKMKSCGTTRSMNQNTNMSHEVAKVKTDLVQGAISLLKDHGIKQDEMFKWIREGLLEYVNKANIPRQRIMYNTAYGGYSLSDAFVEYCNMRIKQEFDERQSDKKHKDGINSKDINCSCESDIDEHEYTPEDASDDTLEDASDEESDEIIHTHDNNRVSYVKYIEPFGKSILDLEKYKGLFSILYLYKHHNMDEIVSFMNLYTSKKKDLDNLRNNMDRLRSYINDTKSIYFDETTPRDEDFYYYPPCYMMMCCKDIKFSRYKRCDLENFIASYTDVTYGKKMEEYKDNVIRLTNKDVFASLEAFTDEFENNIKSKRKKRHYAEENKSFIDTLHENGYASYETWWLVTKYNVFGIMYLLYKQKEYQESAAFHEISNIDSSETVFDYVVQHKHITINEDDAKTIYETMGLLCASGAYCDLKIKDIPGLLEWSIGEYDGKEDVFVV